MAFNPFEKFRKHQRTLMAFAAIICMFVFIFSFGQGDFFQSLQDWLANKARPTELVATLYNQPIHEVDVEKQIRLRDMANNFMVRTAEVGAQLAMNEFEKQQKEFKEGQENPLGRVMQGWGMRRNPFFAQQMRLPPGWQLMSINNDLSFLTAQLALVKNPDQVRPIETLSTALAFELWEATARIRGAEELYFGGTRSIDDSLDHLVWQKLADKLDIHLNDQDIRRAVNREAANQEIWPEGAPLRIVPTFEGMSQNGLLSESELLEALRNEFQVLLAKETYLGETPGVRGIRDLKEPRQPFGNASTPSPFEFFQFYKDQRSSLGVLFLPVSVDSFLSQIKEEPTEKELESFFNAFKDNEENPASDRPGFKKARRIRVEYATARPDSPVFRKKAQVNALAPQIMRTLAFTQAIPPGTGLGGAFGTILPGFSQEPMYQEYKFYKESRASWFEPPFTSSETLHEQSLQHATLATALVGQIAGTAQTRGPVFLALATYPGGALAHESAVRLKVISSTVLACATTNPYAAITLPFPYVPAALPMEAVLGNLFEKYLDISAPRMLRESLALFDTDLGKSRAKPKEAEQVVAKGASVYGLEVHSCKSPSAFFEIGSDPALAELKKSFQETYKDAPQVPEFFQLFFQGIGTYDALRWSPEDRIFQNDPGRWIFAKEPYLVWRAEDLSAADRTFAEAKPLVLRAWKLQKARKLAREQAEKIVAEAKKKTWPANYNDLVREAKGFLTAALPGKKDSDLKELNGITKLNPVPTTSPGQARTYQPYRVPTDILPYPRMNFTDQILTLNKPGDSLLMRDYPETTYYAAILLARAEPSPMEFKKVFENASIKAKEPDSLWQLFVEQYSRDLRNELMRKLRLEASSKLDDNGRISIPDKVRNRATRSDEGS
ncbi:MAG: hypothetical protein EXR99_02945 [Gemmataceae bacterium]|nr:hypothetical protein [Gemmataceae bacterium]